MEYTESSAAGVALSSRCFFVRFSSFSHSFALFTFLYRTPMDTASTATAQQFEYKAEMKQLLQLIVHSLYTHPEVFVRELVSNASDALNKVRYRQLTDSSLLDADKPLEIRLTLDKEANTFTIEDNGIGMTREDLIQRLGTVASSGTLEFLKQVKESGGVLDGNVIGQFGVGFYAVFMVADEVSVETRHADPDSIGFRWTSDGKGTFSVEEIEKPTRGTRISFKLKDNAAEFADEYRLKSIIAKYSNFVDFPILLASSGQAAERINSVKALWQASASAVSEEERTEFYKFLTNDFQPPLGHLHLSIEGAVDFKALLFIPETAPLRPLAFEQQQSAHLYSNKVMIQQDCKELLPEYLRFVRGVVDTDALPLNVSRETVQSSPELAKIRKVLTSKILNLLQEWATEDPAKYEKFFRAFGPMLKLGINSDYANRDALVNLLRFETSLQAKGTLHSLKDYAARMKPEQTEIYFLSGEHRDVMLASPNLEYFQKHGLEVLLLTDPVDIVVVPSLFTYEGKSIVSIDKADVNVGRPDAGSEAASSDASSPLTTALLDTFKAALGDNVENVVASRRLVDSAVTLVVGANGMDVQMEKMMKALDKDFTGGKKVLEVNMEHPLIKNLSRIQLATPDSPLVRQYALHLYESALLVEGNLTTPTQYVRRLWEMMADATKQ
jgi:molecular chaperone HtpG